MNRNLFKGTSTTSRRAKLGLGALLSVVAIGVGTVGLAAPANAAAPASCDAGTACFWKDTAYKSGGDANLNMWYEHDLPNFQHWNYGHSEAFLLTGNTNDSASSIYNNGNTDTTYWYTDANRGGYYFTLPIKEGDNNLANSAGAVDTNAYNDQLSSAYFYSCLIPVCG